MLGAPGIAGQGRAQVAWQGLDAQRRNLRAMSATDLAVRRAVVVPMCAVALVLAAALGACGSSRLVPDADASADDRLAPPPASTSPAVLAATARAAQRAYNRETKGSKLKRETDRIARDKILLGALGRGDAAAARSEARAQLLSAANHFEHVTRISVARGSRTLVNATLNSDGSFVDAPARRELAHHGHRVGTLLVSIQDVTGFVKLVHRSTLADVVVRGASGQVRTSLPAAAHVRLPASGNASIAGRNYTVRSFGERGWGGEPLTVWILGH